MEVEYIYMIVGVFTFMLGLFFGVNLVKFFSSEITYKLEKSLELQLKMHQIFLNKSSERLIMQVEQKLDFIDQINTVLRKTKELLSANKQEIEQLNEVCDRRYELEQEIIKLKNIVKRMEKKL
jgi:regulator of sigma D